MKVVLFVPNKEGIFINSHLEEVYTLPDNRTLYIRPEVLEKMFKYKQLRRTDSEAGGILIGRILEEDENIIIDDASEPMPTDKRRRTRFSRKPEGHQEYTSLFV
jgi:hypothetical protein